MKPIHTNTVSDIHTIAVRLSWVSRVDEEKTYRIRYSLTILSLVEARASSVPLQIKIARSRSSISKSMTSTHVELWAVRPTLTVLGDQRFASNPENGWSEIQDLIHPATTLQLIHFKCLSQELSFPYISVKDFSLIVCANALSANLR